MGYKAEIKKLNKTIELKDLQIDTLFAALKAIVMEKGNTDEGDWRIEVPMFVPEKVNEEHELETLPNEEAGTLTFHVKRREEDAHEEET